MMRAPFAFVPVAVVVALAGCAPNTSATPTPTPTPTTANLTVRGAAMGAYWQNILVSRGTAKIDSATVTVNGTTIPNAGPGRYYGHLPSPLNEGDMVTLVVTDGNQKVEASAALPPRPSFTQPTQDQKVDATQPLDTSWTLSSDPEKLTFYLNWTGSGGGSYYPVTPSSRSQQIPANTIAKGVDAYVEAFAYTSGASAFTGDYASGSAMNLRSDGIVDFTTLP